jgi:diguanylate cyclase (GGDEF)-like protein/PAS domain S-box-containing protein
MSYRVLNNRKQLVLVLALMVGAAVIATTVMAVAFYRQTIEEQRWWLANLLKEEASLISAVARFDLEHSQQDHPEGALGATLSQIAEAYESTGKFGLSGEIVLARQRNGEIEFLLGNGQQIDSRFSDLTMLADAAEPMRRALAGEAGTTIALDYRNVTVLAAYQPLPELNMGIVAKIDLSEIRATLIRDTVIGGIGALLIISLGALLARRLSAPMINQLQSVVDNLNEAQNTAGLGSWYWDIRTGKEGWSDEQFRIFGYQPNEIAPAYKTFIQAIHPEDRENVEEAIALALKDHEPYQLVFRILRPNGELRFIEAQGVVHRDARGKPISMSGTVLDITERKRLERVLARERERAEEFLRISQAMIVGLDVDGRVTLLNPHACDVLGYGKNELLGRNWFETVVADEFRDGLLKRHQAIFNNASDVVEYEEYAVITRSGKRRYIAWHNSSKTNSAGEVIGCLNSGVDVTTLKQAEETSRHMASHDALTGLPNRILFSDRLQQAMAKAQRENTLVGLLYLDLNKFKPVNDTLGHATGDALLKEVADRLQKTLREVDTVARMGGDEFTVILGGITSRDTVEAMADKIAITLARPYDIEGNTLHISASIGTVLYPVDATTVDALLAIADEAMYTDKRRHVRKPRR